MLKNRMLLLFLVLSIGIMAFACSSSSDGDNQNADGDQTETDGDTEATESSDKEASEANCYYASDCGDKEDCVEGDCVSADKCKESHECPDIKQMCWYNRDKNEEFGSCRYFCTTDMDCEDTEDRLSYCLNGLCEKYTPMAKGTAPEEHPDWNGKLHAQFASELLDWPMTTTLAGYGTRPGPPGPYSKVMGSSAGSYDRLRVKVLTLDDGEDRVVFVTLPICFPTDFLVNGIVMKVMELGGPDLSNNIVVNGSHTHSGPGRYWNFMSELGVGVFGFGDFNVEIFDRLVASIAGVVNKAQSDLKPAKFGYKLINDFDPDNKINHDRRPENGFDGKDNDLLVIRVDEIENGKDKPWVILTNHATHGTVTDKSDPTSTNDAPGASDNMVQLLFEKEFDVPINTMFINGNAGDVGPAGGDLRNNKVQQLQLLGTRVYEKVIKLYKDLDGNMKDSIDVEIVSKRIPINREYIGYKDDEFYSDGESFGEFPPGGPIRFGAFMCTSINTPIEENLDLYAIDKDGGDIKKSTGIDTDDEGEDILFTPKYTGTFYFKVIGKDKGFSDYTLTVAKKNRGTSRSDFCLDAKCGKPCGSCPNFIAEQLPSVECTEDALESNDDMSSATAIELGKVVNGQICPDNEDWFKIELTEDETIIANLIWKQDKENYNPETRINDGNLACPMHMEAVNHGPLPQFSKTKLTSVMLDRLYLAGLPGEALSAMGRDATKQILDSTNGYYTDVKIFGFTNDHHFYISTEPDWFQGGYEATMSIWGFKFGKYLIDNLTQLAIDIADGKGEESAKEFPKVKPLLWYDLPKDYRVPIKTAKPTDKSVVIQPAEKMKKMQGQALIKWIGGDPGVDFPVITLEKSNTTGDFETVKRPGGRNYDDTFYEMVLQFQNDSMKDPNNKDADKNNYWVLTWDEDVSFATGIYRFRINGNYYNGSADSFDLKTGVEAYEIYTESFTIEAADIDIQNANYAKDTKLITASLRYGQPYSNLYHEGPFEGISNLANKLHSLETSVPFIGPRVSEDTTKTTVKVQIDKTNVDAAKVNVDKAVGSVWYVSARDEAGVETTSKVDNQPVTTVNIDTAGLSTGKHTVTIDVTDSWGNVGQKEFEFTVE